MESLHYGKILGEDRTNIGFCWEIATGIYYANLGGEGVAVDGDAEPSTASGGCSEAEHPQRSKKSSKRAARRFFRAPQGGGGRCACGYLGSVSVRSTDDAFASFVSSTASDRKGFVKGESVPLDRILVPFVRTKGTPRRRAVQIMPLQKAPRRRRRSQTGPRRIGEIKPSHSLCRQPLSQPCG